MDTQTLSFLLEYSPTPIYQRIIHCYEVTLRELGYGVVTLNPGDYPHLQDYLHAIAHSGVDGCWITNSEARLASYVPEQNRFLYELIDLPLIFIHHDNLFGSFSVYRNEDQRLPAFYRTRQRSCHFCVEAFNLQDLKTLGIRQSYPIRHASEFTYTPPDATERYPLSFVGHVLPEIDPEYFQLPAATQLQADLQKRLSNFATELQSSAIAYAQQSCEQAENVFEWLTAKYYYIFLLNLHSNAFRGALIQRLCAPEIHIFGGDPAALVGLSRDRRLSCPGVRYHPATCDPAVTQQIYANSTINLNITSLQFDQAVNNRILDVAAVGGFVLTDWKSDLEEMTSVHAEISYRTIDELEAKIAYYSAHEAERAEIAQLFHREVSQRYSYQATVIQILSHFLTMHTREPSPYRIDLGCGPFKSAGFIGVDIAAVPGVDVVADLTQAFPFADSSIDEVRAHDVIEHLPDSIHTMNEIWRICKPGATVDIRVPSTEGRGAFQDPTHISFWNLDTFRYYCIEFPEQLAQGQHYGFQGAFQIQTLTQETSPGQVIHVLAKLTAMKP
ncbi:glycosyltransferase family protein [Neosynechococcus sphagnicola]|uniref:glycosyltransferase family protein n=1 Tax=Neosynechococcus sphagnicola TaxID=1501145 RepID=UPI00068E3243|nr:glycosyltransferase [Neosynechococcus sphagnicola]